MRCPTTNQLAEYLENLCPPRQRQRLSLHIDACAQCRREVAALRRATELLQAVPAPAMPDALWAGVAARITTTRPQAVSPWRWRALVGVGLAASLLAGLLAGNSPQPALPLATASTASYVTQQQLLSARDPLADRVSIGMLLAADKGNN